MDINTDLHFRQQTTGLATRPIGVTTTSMTTHSIQARLELARSVAIEAGTLAQKMRANRGNDFVQSKGVMDFVTLADLQVEKLIRQKITEAFPDDAILGEEGGTTGAGTSLWVLDPIDGTTNYLHGLPDWAISIAYCQNGQISAGVVNAPDLNCAAWASKGGGAFLNGFPTSVSNCQRSDQSLVILGRSERAPLSHYLGLLKVLTEAHIDYRRNGSAAVSLMSVAAGRAEAYYERHLNAWDAFAALLIIEEAGGAIMCSDMDTFIAQGSEVLASNQCLHQDLMHLLDKCSDP